MQYLVIFLAVLALASPAMSACLTADMKLEVRTDCDLPDSSAVRSVTDCDFFAWKFEFDRTDSLGSPSLITIIIEGSPVHKSYPSLHYPPNQNYRDGPNKSAFEKGADFARLRINGDSLRCGNFSRLELKVNKIH